MARTQKTKQLEFRLRTWGGKRKGAGRKRVALRQRVPHVRRHEPRYDRPLLVTIRLCDGVPSLRRPAPWAAIVRLLRKARGRFGMHVVAYSVLRNHLHLIVECDEPDSLERGMRGLNTRIAKQLNKLFERRGRLIDGRYHSRELATPLEVRNALRYVLFNHAKHELKLGRRRPTAVIDPRSSAAAFTGWHTPADHRNRAKDFGTARARTWLLRIGWKRHGLLDFDELPDETAPPPRA